MTHHIIQSQKSKRKRYCLLVLCTLSLLPIAPSARAGGEECDCPGSSILSILANTIHVLNAHDPTTVGCLCIEKGGVLQIPAGRNLIVINNLFVHPEGKIEFTGSSGNPSVFMAGPLAALSMDGTFESVGSAGGRITRFLTGNVQLRESGRILSTQGPITIETPIDNDGLICANGSNSDHAITFLLAPSVSSSGKFECSGNESARMIFDFQDSQTILNGADFEITDGQMIFKAGSQLTTNGGMRISKGRSKTSAVTAEAGDVENEISPGMFSATGAF